MMDIFRARFSDIVSPLSQKRIILKKTGDFLLFALHNHLIIRSLHLAEITAPNFIWSVLKAFKEKCISQKRFTD